VIISLNVPLLYSFNIKKHLCKEIWKYFPKFKLPYLIQ